MYFEECFAWVEPLVKQSEAVHLQALASEPCWNKGAIHNWVLPFVGSVEATAAEELEQMTVDLSWKT